MRNRISKKDMDAIIRKAGQVNRFYSRWTEVDKKNGTSAVFADYNNDLFLVVKKVKNQIWCSFKSPTYTASRYCTLEEAHNFINIAMLHA